MALHGLRRAIHRRRVLFCGFGSGQRRACLRYIAVALVLALGVTLAVDPIRATIRQFLLAADMPALDVADLTEAEAARYSSAARTACFLGARSASMDDCCAGDSTKLYVVLGVAPPSHVVKRILEKVDTGAGLIADGSLLLSLLEGAGQQGGTEVLLKLARDRSMKPGVMNLVLGKGYSSEFRSPELRRFLGLDGDVQYLFPRWVHTVSTSDCRIPANEVERRFIRDAREGRGSSGGRGIAGSELREEQDRGSCFGLSPTQVGPVHQAFCSGNMAPVLCVEGVNGFHIVGVVFPYGKGGVFLSSLRSRGWPRQWSADERYSLLRLVLALLPEAGGMENSLAPDANPAHQPERLGTACLAARLKGLVSAPFFEER